jgi:hypothetical protein
MPPFYPSFCESNPRPTAAYYTDCNQHRNEKQSIEWDTAILQVGIWAAAQFAKLEELIEDSPLTEAKSQRVEAARRNMPFLPLIIVLGHDWYFLAATRESDGETRVWSKVALGDTMTPLGVYQIVATLMYLAKWSVELMGSGFGRRLWQV